MENGNSTLIILLVLIVSAVGLILWKTASFIIKFNAYTRHITTKIQRAYGMDEYHYWRRELRCHYLCLIPFVTEWNVMWLYHRIYHKSRHVQKEKRSDGLYHILAPSVIGACICVVCLCGASWAWFAASQTSGVTTIQAATYTVTVHAVKNDTEIAAALKAHNIYEIPVADGQKYSIKLSATGTASTGYAVIYFAGDEDNKTYTQQIPVDTDFDFTVHANGNNALVIEIQWGTCALDGVNKLADQGVIGTVTAP